MSFLIKEGYCPFCKADSLVEGTHFIDANLIEVECFCSKCDRSFTEYYTTTYDGCRFCDDDGELRDFDANGEEQ